MFKAAFALGALVQCFSGSFAGGFLKHLGDVATVILDLVCLRLFCFMSFSIYYNTNLQWVCKNVLYTHKCIHVCVCVCVYKKFLQTHCKFLL